MPSSSHKREAEAGSWPGCGGQRGKDFWTKSLTCFRYGEMTPTLRGLRRALPFLEEGARSSFRYDVTVAASSGLKKDGLLPSLSSLPITPWKMMGKPWTPRNERKPSGSSPCLPPSNPARESGVPGQKNRGRALCLQEGALPC